MAAKVSMLCLALDVDALSIAAGAAATRDFGA